MPSIGRGKDEAMIWEVLGYTIRTTRPSYKEKIDSPVGRPMFSNYVKSFLTVKVYFSKRIQSMSRKAPSLETDGRAL